MRFTGLCSMIAGVLFLSLSVFYNVSSLSGIGSFVNLLGMALLALGLVGIYLRQMNAVGVFGFIVFLIAFIGTILWAGWGWAGAFIVPVLEDLAPELVKDVPPGLISTGMMISLLTFFGGLVLFGIVTALKGILPRGAAILLIIVPILDFIPYGSAIAQPLAGVALLWLGYAVWKGNYEEANTGIG
jgi:hypothetical protein